MSCDRPTYVSSNQGEGGEWEFTAECDGPRECGFRMTLDVDDIAEVIFDRLCHFGLTSEDMAAWDAAHRTHAGPPGRPAPDTRTDRGELT